MCPTEEQSWTVTGPIRGERTIHTKTEVMRKQEAFRKVTGKRFYFEGMQCPKLWHGHQNQHGNFSGKGTE